MVTLNEAYGHDATQLTHLSVGKQVHDSPGEMENAAAVDGWSDSLSEDLQVGFTTNDRKDMHRMGKKQEFRRNFKTISTVAFTSCVMGTWEIMLTSNTQGLTAGGLAGLFWSLCWVYVGQFFIVLSLAEMASMAPTAGGQYHWVSEFSPPNYQKILSYISGWLSTLYWQSIIAVQCFLVGSVLQGLITLNDTAYTATRWQDTLIIIACVIGVTLFNIFASKHLPLAEGIFVAAHLLGFFPVVITLLVLSPKNSAKTVFTDFTDNGANWPSLPLTVMVGQVSNMFVVFGSDSAAHMSEEIEDAGIVVPRGMVWSFLLNVPFAFGLLLTYLFCMINVEDALASKTGFPFIYVFETSTRSTVAATWLTVLIFLLLIMITISCVASTSRQTFAFARDDGLPFSNWLKKVHPKWHVPVNSLIFTCLFSTVLSLINIGSTVAFNAMISLSTVALMATYTISIGCVALKRARGQELPSCRWSLGRSGLAVNTLALIYSCWSFFWSCWPNNHDITAENFNWACVLFAGLMGLSGVLYMVRARHVYECPVVKVQGRKIL